MADDLRITAEELKERIQSGQGFTVIDTRNPQAWAEANDRAAGALRVPIAGIQNAVSNIPKNKPVVAYCT